MLQLECSGCPNSTSPSKNYPYPHIHKIREKRVIVYSLPHYGFLPNESLVQGFLLEEIMSPTYTSLIDGWKTKFCVYFFVMMGFIS